MRSVRIALTPLHGVGGAVAVETLRRAGFDHVHTVGAQFAPDPDFPTVAFPNPEEPGAADALLALAAVSGPTSRSRWIPTPTDARSGYRLRRGWRMLSGDETGWLLGDYILSHPLPENPVVASTVVSSRMLAAIAARHGAVHVETRTGFKWLARADENVPAGTLVYAYEEAIGHCVDPTAVRDKDGISAAVLVCDLVAALRAQGSSVPEALDELARRHGVHEVAAVSRRVADSDEATDLMRRLRAAPPDQLAGFAVTITDITDALIFTGGDDETSVRVVVRPSGTEPKLKCYIEVRRVVTGDLQTGPSTGRSATRRAGPAGAALVS